MLVKEELMLVELNDDAYEEDWIAVINKNNYPLSKNQALIVKQAMATGERGSIVFDSFAIPLAFVQEFYRVRRYLKDTKALSEKATEKEYIPIKPERWEILKKEMYSKIAK